MSKNIVKSALDFFQTFTDYEAIGNMAFIDNKNNSKSRLLRQVKANEVKISNDGLTISINNQMAGYIKNKLSPVVKNKNKEGEFEDINKLLLSLALIKFYFEEKEDWIYMPLISVDISNQKKIIFEALRSGSSEIFIPWESTVVVNEHIINTFFDLKYEENGEMHAEYFSEFLEDIIPINSRDSLKSFMKSLYVSFKENKDSSFEIIFPELNSEKSSLFMFFNSKNDIKIKRSYDQIKKNTSPLLEEYLTFSQEENKSVDFSDTLWLGSLTKDFPLGKGQSIVMQENEKNKKLLAVEGAPGTGKTTLFLSVIANEITKRALSLINGNDYSNLMIVTSTSNKAIENVYISLKHGFKHGFVYIGGNANNKNASALEVKEYIDFLDTMDYDKDKQNFHKEKILHTIKLIKEKEEIFNLIKSFNLNIKSYKELKKFLEKSFKKDISEIKKIFIKVSKKLKTKSLSKIKEIKESEEFDYFLDESKSRFSIKSLFKNKDSILEDFNKTFNLKIEDLDILHETLILISKIDENAFQFYEEQIEIKKAEKAMKLIGEKEKFFNGIQKYDSFAEYFRTNLFAMNYSIYISSINFMNQEILKNKDKVVKAIKYLSVEDQYNYLINNYGYDEKKQKEFLKYLSLAYPVHTSTLAAIQGVLPGLTKVRKCNLLLADEAGMIASHSIIPAMNISNRAIIVGDPKQLEPIVPIAEIFLTALKNKYSEEFWNMYSPTLVSAYHRSAGTLTGGYKNTGRGIILDEHRRCAPKIANLFIDIAEYHGLSVCTTTKDSPIGDNLFMFDIKNKDTESFKKINYSEIEMINQILRKLFNAGYNLSKDIGIITPYKDQEVELIKYFGQVLNHVPGQEAKIGTVHKFQGVEYKVVIFSTVLSRDQDSLSFINSSPSLINVAISRSKEAFMVVGDYEKLTEDSSYENFVGRMCKHIKLNGVYSKINA